jgi:hypothetical protein
MSDLTDDVLNLQWVWTSADHTRQCGARYGSGACTCGYDNLLDFTITQVINHLDEGPGLTKAEVDDMMVKLSREALPMVEANNPLLALLRNAKKGTAKP